MLSGKVTKLHNSDSPPKKHRSALYSFSSILLLSIILTIACLAIHVQQCPPGYDEYLPYRKQCCLITNDSQTWADSSSVCNGKKGNLLEPYTLSEMKYIQKIMKYNRMKNIWLGADSRGKGEASHLRKEAFLWRTNEREPTYEIPWASGFPANIGMKHSCASLIGSKEQWINAACIEKMRYI